MNPDMHPNKQKQIRDIKSVFDTYKMPNAKKYKEAVLRSGQRSSTRPRSEEFQNSLSYKKCNDIHYGGLHEHVQSLDEMNFTG